MMSTPSSVLLRNGGTSAFIHMPVHGLPEILHWGSDLGALSDRQAADVVRAETVPMASGTADTPARLSLIPQQSEGWIGTPGLVGSRDGRAQFPLFATTAIRAGQRDGTDGSPSSIEIDAHDDEADLDVTLRLELTPSGLLRARATLRNAGRDGYALDSLLLALPTPASETLVLDQSGHHLRERDTATHAFTIGAHERALRIARGHTASTIHGTCQPGTGWGDGLVHYLHVAWSGNVRTLAEKDTQGFQALMGGELLMPGEVVLSHGEAYETPWLVATWGRGLDAAAQRIHAWMRARPQHPRTPRPVTLNAWEAVYFDHSMERLLPLVQAAADAGVERFVLDDGWFGSRRDDHSGLGDWQVSPEVWPDGLGPLSDAVHARGMQFGLWVEPEMVNPDSDLARAHPDWILTPTTHRPQEARHQQVLDLTNPACFENILAQILAVVRDARVDALKWDFNRDVYEAVSPRTGRPAYHAQTLAAYALMDAVLAACPGLEIESCAGGGGRIDLGVMERAARVWGSDCIDPLERQIIETGTSLLLPPELVGSHVASTTSHSTGRTLALSLRASTALFGHMGIEWDLTSATAEERRELAGWVALHRALRPLLHSGRVVHADHPDAGWSIHGVITADEGVYALTRVASSAQRPTPPLRLRGLDPDAAYRVSGLTPEGLIDIDPRTMHAVTGWWADGLALPGRVLAEVGLRIPDLNPEQAVLLQVRRL